MQEEEEGTRSGQGESGRGAQRGGRPAITSRWLDAELEEDPNALPAQPKVGPCACCCSQDTLAGTLGPCMSILLFCAQSSMFMHD